jgi:hypothetical protein
MIKRILRPPPSTPAIPFKWSAYGSQGCNMALKVDAARLLPTLIGGNYLHTCEKEILLFRHASESNVTIEWHCSIRIVHFENEVDCVRREQPYKSSLPVECFSLNLCMSSIVYACMTLFRHVSENSRTRYNALKNT